MSTQSSSLNRGQFEMQSVSLIATPIFRSGIELEIFIKKSLSLLRD